MNQREEDARYEDCLDKMRSVRRVAGPLCVVLAIFVAIGSTFGFYAVTALGAVLFVGAFLVYYHAVSYIEY